MKFPDWWPSQIQPAVNAGALAESAWSATADVIVAGYGGAGVCAALEAVEGGLSVDEKTGRVRSKGGGPIKGLYAGGRTAIGVCSNLYVGGLSVADCVFSGRRAAKSLVS